MSVILITGGTGSFGQAMTRFLLAHTSATIRIFSRSELSQAMMRHDFPEERVRYILGDVRDVRRLSIALRGVNIVIHAAALKRIEQGEYDPMEFIATNVNGTVNVAEVAMACGVETAIFLGSDKCIHPLNVYGASKAIGERAWTRFNAYTPSRTRFVSVRYANVAGSRGSVIPAWRAVLARGEQPGMTSVAMTRFHLTLAEAVQVVWFAIEHAPQGAILVPHVRAYALLDLYTAVCGDVPYRLLGIRPGEKLHEELMTEDEMRRAWLYMTWETEAARLPYYVIPPVAPTWPFPALEDLPAASAWSVQPPSSGPVSPCGPYRSDVWPWRLDVAALRTCLREEGL